MNFRYFEIFHAVTINCRVLFAISILCAVATAMGQVPTGRSEFQFDGWDGPPISVRLYIPDNVSPDTPIVIVMHGWSRAAERYFDDWSTLGEDHGFIVVVPHFPVEDFPTSNDYNQGHVFDAETGRIRPQSEWTFSAIEALFDDVVAKTGGGQTGYTLFGHSAGSQFVHRFLYYMPEARVNRYIAANAGWYTLPDFDTEYPYGLNNAAIDAPALKAAFERDVVLMLGREDVNHLDADLRNTPEAKQQGKNRFARGMTMFRIAKTTADKLGVELRWQFVIVDEAGHSNSQMAPAAVAFIE